MTIQELLENAHLEALGLLDPEEQAAFDLAYARAPEGVKAQVRGEQARVAANADLFPDAEPPASLREKVLAGVRAAMLESEIRAVEAEPLTIGRRVAPWWRPTAVGMLSAAVLMGAAFVSVYNENANLRREVAGSAVMNDLMGLRTGAGVLDDTLFSSDVRRIVFERTDAADEAAFPGRAALYSHPRWESSRFYCADLPQREGRVYRLVVLSADDRIDRTIDELAPERAITTRGISGLAGGARVAVVSVAVGAAFNPATDILLVGVV